MRPKKGRRSPNRSKSRSASPQTAARTSPSPPDRSLAVVPRSQPRSHDDEKPKLSFRRLFGFGKASSRTSGQSTASSMEGIAEISWDGFTEALKVAKESSDWNPFLMAALGGVVAVIDLGKQVKENTEEMATLVTRIESLQSTLEMRRNGYRLGENRLSSHVEQCARTFEQEIAKLKKMKTRGKIRRIMQRTSDANRLLGVYRCIPDILNDLQYAIGLSIEYDTSFILQIIALKNLPVSVVAWYNAAIDHNTVSRQACTKDTRLSAIKPILSWISAPDSAPVYWLTGPAGMGKTTIAQTICRYIVSPTGEYEDAVGSNELKERRLVSYFCSRQLDSGESKRLVPTLCRQLAGHSSSYARELVRALEEDSNLPHAELPAQLQGLLVGPWESSVAHREGLPSKIVVVDALDENQGGFEFLDLLLDAVDGHRIDGLRFLLTSRTDPNIAKRCQSFHKDTVHRLQDVPGAEVQRDITLYLNASLPKVEDQLLRRLADIAGGLFIYASLVVKMTGRASRADQEMIIRQVLDMTPSDLLNDFYSEIVHEAIYHENEAIQRSRLHVLHTVLCKHALYDPSPSNELIYQLSTAQEDIFSTVLDGLHAVMYEAEDGSILAYHTSFPNFILRPPSSFSSSVFLNPLCDEGLHHAHLTRRCYEIMVERLCFNICNLQSSFTLDKDIPDLPNRIKININPVLEYAVLHWMDHLVMSRPDEDNLSSIPLCNIPLAFVDNLSLYWLEVLNLIFQFQSLYGLLYGTDQWILQHCPEHSDIWDEMEWFYLVSENTRQPSTPHIYISLLSLWKPGSHISRMWRPRFCHLPNIASDGQRNHTNITQIMSQDSKETDNDAHRDDRKLVGLPPRGLDPGDTGWVLSEDGYRMMWLPNMVKQYGISMKALQKYMLLPELDQISFNLRYLGPNWVRIYESLQ